MLQYPNGGFMAKYYGITCDKCAESIVHPSQHYKLILKFQLNNLERFEFDLCRDCYEEVLGIVKTPTINER
jgi:hypothetical protein